MAEHFEDQPPAYSQVERKDAAAVAATAATVTHNENTVRVQNTGYPDYQLNQANRHANRFSGEIGNHRAISSEGIQETTDNSNNNKIGKRSASNSFKGFMDVMHKNKKLSWSFEKNTVYKAGLLAYFFFNLVYSSVATAVQQEHLAYHLVYILINIIGFVVQFTLTILSALKSETEGSATSTSDKAKSVLIDYVLFSLGEFLIYPTLICTLYGFVNERAWRFDNGTSISNFLFFLYSVIMDTIYVHENLSDISSNKDNLCSI